MLTHLTAPSLNFKARQAFMLKFYDRWLSALEIPVPLVVAIQGHCIGVAPVFALLGDISIAEESAQFEITFASLALYPGMAISHLLPKAVGPKQAALLLLAGNAFSGTHAARIGLVSQCAAPGTALEEALLVAWHISTNGDAVVRQMTHTLRVKRAELDPILAFDAARQTESYATAEFRERICQRPYLMRLAYLRSDSGVDVANPL